jgi:hypothetical protein
MYVLIIGRVVRLGSGRVTVVKTNAQYQAALRDDEI